MKEYSTKDFGKIAFVVGFGYVVGKNVGELVNTVIDGALGSRIVHLAKNGNELCRHACDERGIDYGNESNEHETKVVGFLRQ